MIYLPFLIALWLGRTIFGLIMRRSPWPDPIDICASYLIGIGVCSCLAFIQILCWHHYEPSILNGLTIFSILSLALINRNIQFHHINSPPKYDLHWPIMASLLIIAGVTLAFFVFNNPYGDWDAWSLWNFRASFLAASGEHWKDLYTHSIQAKHPWLFPYWILFTWSWGGGITTATPCLNTFFLSLILPVLVICGLREWKVPFSLALLAGAWFISMPYFYYHGASQYPDIMITCFLTIGMIFIMRVINNTENGPSFFYLLGLLMGFMLLTKDEGLIIYMLLLLTLCLSASGKTIYWKRLFLPLAFILPFWIAQKIWMIPAPAGENQIYFGHLVNRYRYVYIVKYYLHMLFNKKMGNLFFIPLMFFVSLFGKNLRNSYPKALIIFLAGFIIFFFLLYILVKENLPWRLWTTVYRLEYQIMPLSVMLLFNLFSSISKPSTRS